jgi:DHA1 family inner membrane transport protein
LFGVGSVVAADLVSDDKRARAIAMMFAGLTVANVLGVPAGTLLSQHVGWRAAFVLIAAVGIAGIVAIAFLVPRQPPPAAGALGRELAAFRNPQVWLSLGVGTFGFAGVFATYSYVEPMMTNVAGYSAASVDWLLALFGLGMTVGNLAGGRLADRALMPSLYGTLGALGLMLALFSITAHDPLLAAATLFMIGATGMACVPIIQTRIMDVARGAPTLAAAANHSAFNLANAGGAFLGGRVIAAGFGWTSPNWVGAALAAMGLALALASGVLAGKGDPTRRRALGNALDRPHVQAMRSVVPRRAIDAGSMDG